MDAFGGLLDGPRARGAFLLRAVFAPPWSMRIEDEAPLTLMAVLAGAAWVRPTADDWVRLGPGDTAVAVGPTRMWSPTIRAPRRRCGSCPGRSA